MKFIDEADEIQEELLKARGRIPKHMRYEITLNYKHLPLN